MNHSRTNRDPKFQMRLPWWRRRSRARRRRSGVTVSGRGRAPGAPGSLVRHWGALRSDSLAFGVSASGVFAPGDRLTVTASAPFRPRGRVAMVLAPAREVADGEVAFAARAVSLASAGREVRTQLVYDAWSGDGASATLGGYARFGADAGTLEGGPDWGIAAKMRLEF